jgi:hypothetical protein
LPLPLGSIPVTVTLVHLALEGREFRRDEQVLQLGRLMACPAPGAGHSLVIDSRWEEVAEIALDFLRRHRS